MSVGLLATQLLFGLKFLNRFIGVNSNPFLKTRQFAHLLHYNPAMTFRYPSVRRGDTVDIYHDIPVPDPYRWLEDADSEETKKFIQEQNALTIPFLESCPIREQIKERITSLWNYPKFYCPFKEGNNYYYLMNTGLQNQNVMYKQESLTSTAEVFIDPNEWSDDGTVSLTKKEFSEDGEYLAYGMSQSGSDWNKIKVKCVKTKADLPDIIENVRYSGISWTHDNKGFFYSCFPKVEGKADGTETTANQYHKLYYHRLNTSQADDVLCMEFPDEPNWRVGAVVSDCGKYLLASVQESCKNNMLYVCDLTKSGITGLLPFRCLVNKFEAEYNYVTNTGSIFTVHTDRNAPLYRLVNIDIENPEEENWVDLVPESKANVLEWALCVNEDKLLLCYIEDVKNVLGLYSLNTGDLLKHFPLELGTIAGVSGKRSQSEIFYKFVSFLTPGITYFCDLQCSMNPEVFKKTEVPGFDASQFQTTQVFYSSKDGTKIPMYIVHRKDIVKDGSAPAFLYGYGGFNISMQPQFSISRTVFMNYFKGVVALPNLRGGGEYGERWHNAGKLLNKQNVFDDFHAAAEYLIDNKYTSPSKLTINGGSNGGLLVGACLIQKPHLYGCAVAQVGVLDMLRFHKFTIGQAWTSDYGCSDDKEQFLYLLKYSPLHNLKPAEYPATLLLTADHDDRVVPLHSLKFIAEMQYQISKCSGNVKPAFIKVDVKSGHGFGKPTSKIIEELTDVYCFMYNTLQLQYYD
ncbi:prolyl endopeptidase-like [Uloborus diversus]|uniref:prolyl endopeptidase-like n=1 Tax=Uloborus diversus TaxID=327109 RepID=UPI0024090052|nr:prolyl endopeptidase-like [Uloborus diversus]